ncbi:MAG: HAD-IA family hydrolase [Actinomycetota bacterium]
MTERIDGIVAVVFDMGGILHPTPFEVLGPMAASRGWPLDAFPRGPFDPAADPDYVEMDRGRLREPEYWGRVSTRLAELSIAFDVHDVVDWTGRDRIEVVDAIRRIGRTYRTAILTNDATDWLGAGWRHRWWLRDAFEVMVDAKEEGLRKPAPDIYRRVLDRLGVEAEGSVFVDDLTINCEGAEAVGMRPFWFDVTQPLESTLRLLRWLLPDEVIASVAARMARGEPIEATVENGLVSGPVRDRSG